MNGSDREQKLELQGPRWWARRWGSWCQAMLGQESRDRFGFRCSLDPTHRPGATWTAVEIDREGVSQEPRLSLRSRRAAIVTLQQLELIASGGWRPALERIALGLGNNFAAERGVTGKHAEIPQ